MRNSEALKSFEHGPFDPKQRIFTPDNLCAPDAGFLHQLEVKITSTQTQNRPNYIRGENSLRSKKKLETVEIRKLGRRRGRECLS